MLPRTTITQVCGFRDAALAKMNEAADLIARGHEMAEEAQKMANRAHGSATFHMTNRSETEAYQRLFMTFNRDASVEMYRKHIDARIWMNLVQTTGVLDLMDKTAKDQLYKGLCNDVPPVNEDTARDTFEHLAGDAKLIFQRGLARAFSDLDRRFKSHDAFKLGSRVILTHVFNEWGSVNYGSRMDDTLADIERVFAVLDGNKRPDPGALLAAIRKDRGDGFSSRQSMTETPYFKVRTYKNGNAHLWFRRDDLVESANLQLADYYGEVLPDAVNRDVHASDLRSKTTALSKDLSFYPSPDPVVKTLLANIYLTPESRVLEPSAGTGAIVKALLRGGARVDAIEVQPDRVAELERIESPRLNVLAANFLQVPANPIYTHVVMNPPFYRTHWMNHVTHAFDFLAPGGTLVAVLPISAELSESKKHKAFRKWASERSHAWDGSPEFRDLPAESFLSSGTRINTIVLTVYRGKEA